jgi:hypothetical protein
VKGFSKIGYADLGYADDAAFNTFLDSLIVLAQGIVENYCNVPISFFDADGKALTNQLFDYRYPWVDLTYYPVLSVEKVEYNTQGYGISPSWTEMTEPDYIIVKERGQLMLVNKTPAIVEQSVRVCYTAGYSAVPDPVKHVCIQVCSNILHIVLQRKISPTVRVDDWTLKMVIPDAFSRELQTMLAPYIRKTVSVG